MAPGQDAGIHLALLSLSPRRRFKHALGDWGHLSKAPSGPRARGGLAMPRYKHPFGLGEISGASTLHAPCTRYLNLTRPNGD